VTGSRNLFLWCLQALLALAFLAAGGSKLAGAQEMVELFNAIGVGQWLRYLTGGIEVLCGLALLVPGVASLAALCLALTMLCATATHLFVIGGSALPAIVLMALSAAVAWWRRPTRALPRMDSVVE
jgi:putative oxidoreductase